MATRTKNAPKSTSLIPPISHWIGLVASRISEKSAHAWAPGLAAQVSEIAVDATQFKPALSSDVAKLNEL
jgi:hypothetical protein